MNLYTLASHMKQFGWEGTCGGNAEQMNLGGGLAFYKWVLRLLAMLFPKNHEQILSERGPADMDFFFFASKPI